MNIINLRKSKTLAVLALGSILAYAYFLSVMPVYAAPPSAPVITTSSQSTSTTPIILTGTGDANMSIQVTGGVSTTTASTTAGGEWSVSVDLNADALNSLQVVSFNTDEEFSSTTTVNITHDSTAPSVPTIESPALPHATSTNPITISGTAEANASVEITGGSTTATTTANGSGSWNASVSLNPNAVNSLLVTSTDAAMNVSTTTVSITHDDTAPVITLSGDAQMTVFNTNGYTEPGFSATDNLDTSVTATSTGSVNLEVAGSNTITYTATDDAGNTASTTRTVNVILASSGGGNSGGNSGGSSVPRGITVAAEVASPNSAVAQVLAGFVVDGRGGLAIGQQGQVLGASSFNFTRLLRRGMRGDDVVMLQQTLRELGLLRANATGFFGPLTANALRAFQRGLGIQATGTLDQQTMIILQNN